MNLIPYVNIKMGTKSISRFSSGNTLALTQRPFAMAGFCPQNQDPQSGWFFHSDRRFIEGIRLTHQPSPWINDYGTFNMMVQSDTVHNTSAGAWSGYRIEESVFRPDYLMLQILRARTKFELTPTERGAAIRLSIGSDMPTVFSVFPVRGNYTYRIDKDCIVGCTDGHSMDAAKDFKMYFVIRFLDGAMDAENTRIVGENGKGNAAVHVALKGKVVEARVGISYISEEQAFLSIEQDCGTRSFATLCEEAEDIWESYLHRIEVDTDTDEEFETFYSCLYRTFLFPHKAYEIDREGNRIHYCPFDGSTRPGVRYTDNGFWDTYRTVYPLFSMIARDEFAEMLEGFVNDYLEGGWLPRWPSIGEVGCMPSTLIDAVIAEAAQDHIVSKEVLEHALEGMLNHANNEAPEARYGRNGCKAYLKYGYVPREMNRESVNLTLDAAYGDWCIAQVAKALGKPDAMVQEYLKRSKNYKNLFDPETGFMRGRDVNGKMADNFDPFSWGGEYTEGSAWQSSFAVQHDFDGLAELYGGKENLLKKLDDLFAAPPIYRVGGYGTEIHEMSEMAACDLGQFAISNQPSFHFPWIYAYFGEPEKCEYWLRKACEEYFSADDDGFPGDEDNGTMAAWYIFACLGIYPLCPGKPMVKVDQTLVRNIKILGVPFVK